MTSIEQFREIFDAVPSAIVVVNADGQFLYVNKRGLELYGIDYTGFEMDKHISGVKAVRQDGSPFPLEDMPVRHSLKSGEVVRNVEMIIVNTNGIRYPVNVSSSPLHDNHGKINGAIVIFEEFIERKLRVNELIESEEIHAKIAEEKYQMLFNSIDQGFFLIDVIFDENDRPIDMQYVEANNKATEMLGRNFTGMKLREIDEGYEEYWFEIFGKVALTGQSIRMEQYADPDKKWYSFYIFKIGDDKSRRIGNIFFDITSRKQAEKETIEAKERLAQNVEEKYRMLFENMDEGFCTIDVIFNDRGKAIDWRYLETNSQFEVQGACPHAAGRLVTELYPQIEDFWFDFYGNVALSGVSARIENEFKTLNKWYEIYAYKIGGPESRRVGALFREVTKRKLDEEALKKSENHARELVKELEHADKNKNMFISSLSHELRNPLAAIKSSITLLELSDSWKNSGKAIDVISRQSNNLSRMVDDLLDVSRINQNKMVLKRERLDLNEIIIKASQDFKGFYMAKDITLNLDICEESLYLDGDAVRLSQMIENLLHNAMKFTLSGCIVNLSLQRVDNQAFICVEDDGIGIESDLLPYLFTPFTQADKSLNRQNSGLGLGLSIVKGISELHGGSISAYSEGSGKGSRFTIQLPIISEKHVEEIEEQCKFETIKGNKQHNILVIEDNRDLADITCELIQFLGYNAEYATSGSKGLLRIKELNPDIIMCDIGLPDMNGYDVAVKIRKELGLKSVFLIACSGYARKQDIEMSMKAGFNLHLAKPVDFATLEKVLNEVK
jgi:PAS domain S-box-containing protein